ncbi:MAG: Coq4 family protein [Cyanobacteriota bacterium]|jgi:ubiquinone biosynthesis protein COQ4
MAYRYINEIATRKNIDSFLGLVDLAAGGGKDANNVFELASRFTHSAPMKACEALLKREPESVALISSRHVIPSYDAEAMRALPKGSLGHTYIRVLDGYGHDVNFFPGKDYFNNLETDADYINFRVLQTHDLHHIISGFSLDNFGEFGVVSMSVSQYNFPAFAFLNLSALLMTWMNHSIPVDVNTPIAERAMAPKGLFEVISQGLAMGEAAHSLFAVPWEKLLASDLQQLRVDLGITPVLSGIRSWASNPAVVKALAQS